MKKNFTLLIAIALCLGSFAQNTQLTEYLEQGKQAYRNNIKEKLNRPTENNKSIQTYIIGDQRTFWTYSLSVMPPQDIEIPATCRAVGEHSYVFVEDAEWNSSINQTDVDEIMFRLEDETLNSTEIGIVEMDTMYFGPIPDELDNDPKVIFFYSALGSYNGSVFDGYFSAYNQMTEAEAAAANAHSNECEMLYMSCDPVDPTGESSMSVLSHELQHLIHFGIDPYEDTWVDEACAEYAMALYGAPDPITGFPDEPNDNLIDWDQQWSDYIQSMLFFVYLSEHYGGPDFIQEIVMNQGTSYTGINNVLANNGYSETFLDIFEDWTNANFIDAPDLDAGKYNYDIFDLPAFSFEYHFLNSPYQANKTLQSCAAHYMRILPEFNNLDIVLTSSETGWGMNVICFEDGIAKEIITSVDGENLSFPQPTSYNLTELTLVIRNTDLTINSDKDYSITLNGINTNIEENNSVENNTTIFPNPNNGQFTVEFGELSSGTIQISDLSGKVILSEEFTNIESWNNTNSFDKGIYQVKLISNKQNAIVKRMIIE